MKTLSKPKRRLARFKLLTSGAVTREGDQLRLRDRTWVDIPDHMICRLVSQEDASSCRFRRPCSKGKAVQALANPLRCNEQLKKLASPLVKFLNDNFDPHAEIIIDCTSARIMSGECSVPITEFVKD